MSTVTGHIPVQTTARQEELSDLLYLRLFPLRRLLRGRIEAMYSEPDPMLFDEQEYGEAADALIRVETLCRRIELRLPPMPVLVVEEEDVLDDQPVAA